MIRGSAVLILTLICINPALEGKPSIWPDLFAGDREFYGSEKEEKFSSTFPLYQVENWNGHFSRRILFLYKYTDYPLYRRTTFYGLYDHIKSKNDERERTFLPVFYSRLAKDYSYRSVWPLIPIVYGYLEKSPTRKRHGLFPFYWSDDRGSHHQAVGIPSLPFLYYRKKSGDTSSYNTLAGLANITFEKGKLDSWYLFPIFFFSRGEYGHATVFPLFYYNKRGQGSYSLNIPILPLYYRRVDPLKERWNSKAEATETYREVVDGSFFHRWRTVQVVRTQKSGEESVAADVPAEVERMVGLFWFIPLYRYRKDAQTEYSNFLFLWGKNYNQRSRLSYSPVSKRYRSLDKESDLQSIDQIHFFHLPLYRHSYYKDRSEVTAAFWLYKHSRSTDPADQKSYRRIANHVVEKDGRGNVSRRLFVPFFFWKAAPQGYLHIPLLYHQHHARGESGCRYALLGLVYAGCKKADREWEAYLLGLHFRRKNSDSERVWLLPFYNRYEGPDKKTRFIFPLLYEKETATEHYRLHIAASITTGIQVFSPEVKLGESERGLYFDYAFSLLGNLFSWESRLYLREPPSQKLKDLEEAHRAGKFEQGEARGSVRPPALEQKFVWKKENYHNYYGWSLLFGLVAKKYADGYHHFRILPGYWHTYHESQSDVVKWTPVYYRFKYEALESLYVYPLLPLPLYSHVKTKSEVRRTAGFWFYMSRHRLDGSEKSLSLFWSLWRRESSPAGSSHRLLPVYAYSRWQEGTGDNATKNKRLISPFYYTRTREAADGSRSEKRMTLPLPLFYSAKTLDRDGKLLEESSFTLGLYSRRKGQDYKRAFYPFYASSKVTYENGTVHTSSWNLLRYHRRTIAGNYLSEKWGYPGFLPLVGGKEERHADGTFEKGHHVFPVYYVERGPEHFETFFLPGVYIHRSNTYSRWNALYLYDRQVYKESQITVNGYLFHLWQTTQSPDYNRYRLGWGLLFSRTNYPGDDYRQNILWAFSSRQGQDYHHSFWPIYWFDRTGSRRVTAILAPLGFYRSLDADGELSYSLATLGHYWRIDRSERKSRFLLLWGMLYTARTEGSRGYESQGILWNVLWRRQKEIENDYQKTSILGGLIYSRTRLKGREWQRFFGLFRTGDDPPRNWP